MKIAVLYHRDADGFGAAYSAWHALNDSHKMLFKSVQYGEPIPYQELRDFNPDQVYILDFSYKAPDLSELASEFNVVVIDHHKSAAEDLKDFPEIQIVNNSPCPCGSEDLSENHPDGSGNCVGQCPPKPLPLFSGVRIIQEQSGCMLAWAFFNPNEDAPDILHYVQDRDLWKFDLEHSKEINAYIATLPFDFAEWAEFYTPLAYDCGKAILAFQARQIESRVKGAEMVEFKMVNPYDFDMDTIFTIPCVNASDNISELGDALCAAFPDAPFSMSYCDRPDGLRSYSLRSRNGFDVSEVAKAFSGGGHAGAAGFSLPSPPKF